MTKDGKHKSNFAQFISRRMGYWGYIWRLFRPERFPTLISSETRLRVRMLEKLEIIEPSQKEKINLPLVRHYATRVAKSNFIEDRLHAIREITHNIIELVFILSIGYFAHLFLGYRISPRLDGSYYFLGFLPEIFMLLIFRGAFGFLVSKISFRSRLLLMTAISLGGLYYLSTPFPEYRLFVWGVVVILVVTYIFIAIDILISALFEKSINTNFPEAIVTYNILRVLSLIDLKERKKGPMNFWGNKPSKNQSELLILKKASADWLEFAAMGIEKYIARRLKTSDAELNNWINETSRKIADALREKKKWLFSPKPDTSKYVTKNLADFLINFLNDDWDFLEKLDAPKKSRRNEQIFKILAIAGKIILGLLPLGILLSLYYLSIISQEIRDSYIGVAILWAIANILWTDPQAKEKVGGMKDIKDLISK